MCGGWEVVTSYGARACGHPMVLAGSVCASSDRHFARAVSGRFDTSPEPVEWQGCDCPTDLCPGNTSRHGAGFPHRRGTRLARVCASQAAKVLWPTHGKSPPWCALGLLALDRKSTRL